MKRKQKPWFVSLTDLCLREWKRWVPLPDLLNIISETWGCPWSQLSLWMLTWNLWFVLNFLTLEVIPSSDPLCHALNWRLSFIPLLHHIQIIVMCCSFVLTKPPWNICGFFTCHTHANSVTLPLINFRVSFKIRVFTFRALHGQAPGHSSELYIHTSPAGPLSSCNQGLLLA